MRSPHFTHSPSWRDVSSARAYLDRNKFFRRMSSKKKKENGGNGYFWWWWWIYMCILLPSGSVGCFKSWVFFRLAGIFFVLWKQATFQFEHRFFIWRNIFKNDEATFQFYRQTQIQQYEINNSTLNQFCAFSFFLLAAAAVVVPGILMEWLYLKHWRKKTQQISLSFSPRRAAFPGSFPGALLSWTAGRWRTMAPCSFVSSSFGSWRVFVCSSPLRCHYYY